MSQPTEPTRPPLVWWRAVDHPELLAPATHAALSGWAAVEPDVADSVAVAAIDPELAAESPQPAELPPAEVPPGY